MKTTLTAIALFAALATSATTASAVPLHAGHNLGLQNYYYYFGAPCADRLASAAPCGVAAAPCGVGVAPCGVAESCNPCGTCATEFAPVAYESVCATSCCGGSGFNILNPFTYFG